MPLIRRAIALILLVLAGGAAEAACQVSQSTPLSLGSAGSYAVRSGGVAQSSSAAGFSCNGSLISIIGTNSARATVSSASGFKLTGPTGDTIPYVASPDGSSMATFNSSATFDYLDNSLISLLTILNGGTLAPKIYVVPGAGANVAAGTYTDTITVQWRWNICHGIGIGGVCALAESGTGTALIQISLDVSRDCRISAPPLSFGSVALVSQFQSVSQAVAVDCTKGATYNVAFTNGNATSARPWRQMRDTAGHALNYNIYRPDGATIWDESNPLAAALPGTGAIAPGQMQPYVAKVDPDQATPPAGHYQDSVSVVISF